MKEIFNNKLFTETLLKSVMLEVHKQVELYEKRLKEGTLKKIPV